MFSFTKTVAIPALIIVAAYCLNISCSGERHIIRDRPRDNQMWNYPDNFEPSHITIDDDGNRWGLFASRRFSGKQNFWAVRSVNGGEWKDPIMLMNAYYFTELKFDVSDSLFRLTFIGIDENYFYDYVRYLDLAPDFPDTVVIELSIDNVTRDRDGDGLPDLLEKEMLLSSRLPDSDRDGKADNVDFCPLGIPVQSDNRLDIYKAAMIDLMKLDDLSNLIPEQDTAWTRYFGTYYIHEPTIAYVAFPDELEPPELTDLPIILIQTRSPLYFGGRQRYGSFTGGVIPHLVFYKPEIDFLEKHATMALEFVERVYRHESATMHFEKNGEHWVVTQVTKNE